MKNPTLKLNIKKTFFNIDYKLGPCNVEPQQLLNSCQPFN